MKNEIVDIEYDYKMSDEERTEKAKQSIRMSSDLDKLEEEFKDDRAVWRQRIKDLKTLRDDASKAFLEGQEHRKVRAEQRIDMDTKQAHYYHNGMLVKSRDLTIEEITKYGTRPMFDDPLDGQEFTEEEQEHLDVKDVMKEETKKGKKKDMVSK